MKITRTFGLALVSGLTLLSACGGTNHDSKQAKEDYKNSLNDSIEAIKVEIDSCNSQIEILREKVNVWLRDFSTVSNPREVAPYIIYTPAKDKYPLTSTGVMARMNDSGQLELVAALAGNHFDQISVTAGDESLSSSVVPNDQALNYRTDNLTTVMFSGQAADSIANLIADNELNPVSLSYINGGKPVIAMKLSDFEKKTVSYTYLLYKNSNELHRLELRVPMLHEKINLIRLHQDKDK